MSTSRLNSLAVIVLLAAVLIGVGLRLDAMHANPNVQHDEAWSYATASGRLGAFEKAIQGGLSGRWVPASAWQYYWQSDSLGDLAHIGPDLAAYDVHPPLYFYVLHVWLMLTGMHHWAGPALNLIFAALTMLALYGLARALGFERLESSLVALVWALSPAVVSISALTRQYDLVALATVLFVWGLVRATAPGERRRWPDAVWVAAAACAALMTHYQTILLLLGGIVFAVAVHLIGRRTEHAPALGPGRRRRRRRRRAGRLVHARIHARLRTRGRPYRRVHEQGLQREAHLDRHDGRARRRAAAFRGGHRGARRPGRRGRRPPGAALAPCHCHCSARRAPRLVDRPLLPRRDGGRRLPAEPRLPQSAAAPHQPVSGDGLAVLRLLAAARLRPLAALAAAPGGGVLPARAASGHARHAAPLRQPAARTARPAADRERHPHGQRGTGELPRFLWSVPGDTPVFAGTQTQVLADPKAWESSMGGNGFYGAFMGGGNDHRHRWQILGIFGQGYDVKRISKTPTSNIYELTPRK